MKKAFFNEKNDTTARAIFNKGDGERLVQNIRFLNRRGMDLRGYGTRIIKRIGQDVTICSPGHSLEHKTGTVIDTRGTLALVMINETRCWFNYIDLK